MTILVLGATGLVGSAALGALRAAGAPVRVMVRDPARAAALVTPGVEVCLGELEDRGSLQRALEGVHSALLVSSLVPEQIALQGNFVQAAAASTRPHIVKLSGLLTAPDSPVRSGRWHARTEAEIAAAGLSHTFLRAPFFMQNLLHLRPHAAQAGEISVPMRQGRIAMVDARDVGAVAAASLLNPARLRGAGLVTGPAALDHEEVAREMARALGRPIALRRVHREQARAGMAAAGMPAWRIEAVMDFYAAFERGLGAELTDTVAAVTGQAPRSLAAFLTEHRGELAAPRAAT